MPSIIYSEGSGLADSIYGKSQEPIKSVISDYAEAFQKNSQLKNIYGFDTSSNWSEKYTSETALADFADVGENGAHPKSGLQEGYSKIIVPHEWKNSFEVTQTMMEDAKFGKVKKKAIGFTDAYNRTREKYGAALLAGGIGSTVNFGGKAYDTTSADGVSLFNASHPSKTGGTGVQSNIFYNSNGFSVSVMDKVEEKMQSLTDDDGNLLAVMPDTIIIPNDAALKRAVIAAIDSEYDPETDHNAVNFQCGLWKVIVWNYLPKTLGGQPYFMMMDSKFAQNYDCLPWVDRVKLSVRSYIDNDTDANVWAGRARFGAGFNNWRAISIFGAGFSASGTQI